MALPPPPCIVCGQPETIGFAHGETFSQHGRVCKIHARELNKEGVVLFLDDHTHRNWPQGWTPA